MCDKLKRENNLVYAPQNIQINCGGKHSLYNIIMGLLNKDDEVILPTPYWVSYEEQIKLADGKVVFCDTGESFKLTANMVEKKLTPKTKLLILNSPSNPTGAVVDESEIRKIADLAVRKKFYVLSDEVYEHFIYDGHKHLSIGSINDDIKKLTIFSSSVSKTYAMTGWRVGYTASANTDFIKAIDNLQSHSTSNPTSISQKAAIEALNGPQDSVKKMIAAFDQRRKYMHQRLNNIPGVKCNLPEGAFYAFPDISRTGLTSMEFSSRLLDEALVAVVPGIAFGSDKHIRLSYATSMEEITRGLDRIEDWIKSR